MKLAHNLNRPVPASAPAFFGDEKTRTCTLMPLQVTSVAAPRDGVWRGSPTKSDAGDQRGERRHHRRSAEREFTSVSDADCLI